MSSKNANTDRARVRALEQQLASKDLRLAERERVLNGILRSRSWRWTEALRSIAFRIRGLAGGDIGGGHRRPSKVAPTASKSVDDGVDFKAGFARSSRVVLEEFLASGARLTIPTTEEPRVSIVLVVWNRAELTLPCLRSLAERTQSGFELIVVDNGSTDRTTALFDRVDGARVYRNDENLYFIHAVNQGAAQARGAHILLLNNDAILLPGTIDALAATIDSAPDIGAVGGKIVFLDGRLQEAGSIIWNDGACVGYGRGDDPLAPPYMFRRDVDYCSGALLLTRKDLFDRLGGFDEAFSPAYYEETDYCVRLWDAGYRVVFDPGAAILHYEFASRSEDEASELQTRHRQLFVERNQARVDTYHSSSEANVLHARSAGKRKQRILVIDDRVPHPYLGSGFPRAHRMLTRLVEWNNLVTMYPTAVIDEDWSQAYSDVPREVEIMLHRGEGGLQTFLEERRNFYDVIVVSRPHNMEKLASHLERHPERFSNTRLVYDAEAIFAAREVRKHEILGNPEEAGKQQALLLKEIKLAQSANTVVSVSEGEARSFRGGGVEKVHVLGHALEIDPTAERFGERSGLLFVGAVHDDASPNGDAVIWLGEEILPKIRLALGDVALTVVGINESDRIWSMASDALQIVGPLKKLRPLYADKRIFIAPTRFSAGVPHKIHEAAAYGIPVVATPLLAEQLGWTDGVHLLVGNTADELAERSVELYTNPTLWEKIRRQALERVARECSPEQFDRTLREVIGAG
jgi:GT2 family glycosyltransferase